MRQRPRPHGAPQHGILEGTDTPVCSLGDTAWCRSSGFQLVAAVGRRVPYELELNLFRSRMSRRVRRISSTTFIWSRVACSVSAVACTASIAA